MATALPTSANLQHYSQNDTNLAMTTIHLDDRATPIIDANTYWYFLLANFWILGNFLSLFGVITNLINVIVFIKMGFKDPINVSLVGLSISDLFSCLTMIWGNLNTTPGFVDMDLPFDPVGIGYVTGKWPHFIFVKITSCITTFITFERCMCITFPLKVKGFMTTKLVSYITVGMYLFVFALVSPMFHVNRLLYEPNSTILTLRYAEDRDQIEPIVLILFGTVLPLVTFFATILFTIILVQTLKKNAAWRDKVSSSGSGESSKGASSRDVKIARMVVLISLLFILCFTPVMLVFLVVSQLPDFRKSGPQERLTIVIFSFSYLLELINASLNIFFYYYRSSNYKAMFDKIFKRTQKQ